MWSKTTILKNFSGSFCFVRILWFRTDQYHRTLLHLSFPFFFENSSNSSSLQITQHSFFQLTPYQAGSDDKSHLQTYNNIVLKWRSFLFLLVRQEKNHVNWEKENGRSYFPFMTIALQLRAMRFPLVITKWNIVVFYNVLDSFKITV